MIYSAVRLTDLPISCRRYACRGPQKLSASFFALTEGTAHGEAEAVRPVGCIGSLDRGRPGGGNPRRYSAAFSSRRGRGTPDLACGRGAAAATTPRYRAAGRHAAMSDLGPGRAGAHMN
jgi:hypothetical protein